jgi:hypothetical protein
LENTHHKKGAGGVAQGVGPEFKSHYCKNKTKQNPKQKQEIPISDIFGYKTIVPPSASWPQLPRVFSIPKPVLLATVAPSIYFLVSSLLL